MTTVGADGIVEFNFYRPDVAGVRIVGDFDGRRDGGITMTSQGGGWWRASAALAAGEYRFRYLADGAAYADFASHGVRAGEAGWESILFVPQRNVSTRQKQLAKMVA
jgi:1,4-alpha-glucan branching enzyme